MTLPIEKRYPLSDQINCSQLTKLFSDGVINRGTHTSNTDVTLLAIEEKRYGIQDHVDEGDLRCHAGATRNRIVERCEAEAIARNVLERYRTSDQEPPRTYTCGYLI